MPEDQWSSSLLLTEQLTTSEVLRFHNRYFHECFTNLSCLVSVMYSFEEEILRHIKNLAQYHLKRKIIEDMDIA